MKKLSKVVMLPTEKASHIYLNIKTNKLRYVSGNYPEDLEQFPQTVIVTQNQHLYFLSDDEIKEGDWMFDTIQPELGAIEKATKESIYLLNTPKQGWKKIIATTDETLNYSTEQFNGIHSWNLPRPSNEFIQKFIEEYNKGNIISEVLVEYETVGQCNCICHKEEHKVLHFAPCCYPSINLKVAPDNTISIYPVERVKKTYTQEEVVKLFEELSYEMAQKIIGNRPEIDSPIVPHHWIKEKFKLK